MEPPNDGKKWHKSLCLPTWDYRNSAYYFITIVTYNRELLLGTVNNDAVNLSSYGQIVEEEWLKSAVMRKNIELDAFVVMPNHFHAILHIIDPNSERDEDYYFRRQAVTSTQPHKPRIPNAPASGSLGAIIVGFKGATTRRIHKAYR